MRLPPAYTLFCAAMLGLFGYSKYFGLALFSGGSGASTSTSTSSSSGSGGTHYTGTSGGSHK